MTFVLSPEAIAACQAVFAKHRSTVLLIVEAVSEASGVPTQHILSTKRTARIARARQIVMFEARQAGLSYHQIGTALGRDHTTIMHGIRMEEKRRGR